AFARGFGRKLADGDLVGQLLERNPVLRPDAALALGRAAEACPHALARAAARDAALTVADYNHVFDPAVALPGIRSGEALEGAVLLVDEPHQLADRVRTSRSAELARGALLALAETAAAGGAPAHGAVREAARALAAGVDAIARDAIGGDAEGD